MQEVFKYISGTKNEYQVSNLGRVKSLKFGKEKILKSMFNTGGYLYVHLSGKKYLIHRLVAKEFLLNVFNLKEVNHKNKVRTMNIVDNLEWCSREDNERHKRGLPSIRVFTLQMKREINNRVKFNTTRNLY